MHYAKQARRIELDVERIAFFLHQAIECRYDQDQFVKARLWILYGDWRFRGNDPTLQWEDFFPTDEQVRDAHQRSKSSLLLVDAARLQREMQNAYRIGFEEGKSQGVARMSDAEVQQLKEILNQWTE